MENTINISDSAAVRIKDLIDKEGADKAFRIEVVAGGCQGFKYRFDFTAVQDGDLVFEKNGAKVVTDTTSIEVIGGSTIDFVEELGESYFAMTNPQATGSCGCGSSFAV